MRTCAGVCACGVDVFYSLVRSFFSAGASSAMLESVLAVGRA